MRKHYRTQPVVLDLPVRLWGWEYRVTEGEGYYNIQRRSAERKGKYRVLARMTPPQWEAFTRLYLAGKTPVDQAKQLHNYGHRSPPERSGHGAT